MQLVSAVVATRNRAVALKKTLESLAGESAHPAEIVVVDSSDGPEAKSLCENGLASLRSELRWVKADRAGAAVQRNQGVRAATQPFIWFFDDDVLFEPNCLSSLWKAIDSDQKLGGVNAMIVNQRYRAPGAISRFMFTLMHGRTEESFAGKVIGPAINLLPEDRDDLPDIVAVEWLNTTCTVYRREALPDPPFPELFSGYSLMEDLALSLNVAKRGWKLANARTARIFHDSQPSPHKLDLGASAAMELLNRHYVMTQVLQRRTPVDYMRLLGWEIFMILSTTTSHPWRNLASVVRGKWKALRELRNNA